MSSGYQSRLTDHGGSLATDANGPRFPDLLPRALPESWIDRLPALWSCTSGPLRHHLREHFPKGHLGKINTPSTMARISPRAPGHDRMRRALSGAANLLLRLALRSPLRDNTGSCRVYSRRLAELLVKEGLRPNYEYAPQAVLVALEQGATLREVPITFRERHSGESKMTARVVLGSLLYTARIALRRNFARRRGPRLLDLRPQRPEDRGVPARGRVTTGALHEE